MQNCLEKDIEFSKEVYERQTTASLRDEINGYLEDHMAKIKAEEASRVKDIKSASKRKDKIQEEIDGLKKYNKDTTKLNKKKEVDDLTSKEFLNLFDNFK